MTEADKDSPKGLFTSIFSVFISFFDLFIMQIAANPFCP